MRAYQILNTAKRLADGARFTKEDALAVLVAIEPHRYALAFLGVIPAKFAAETMPACAQPMRELAAIVSAMGGETASAKREGVRDLVLCFSHLEEVAELRRAAARMVIADFAEPEQPSKPTRKQLEREAQAAQARALYAAGHSVREIAAALGVSVGKAMGLIKN